MYVKFNSAGRVESTSQQEVEDWILVGDELGNNLCLESDGTVRQLTEEEIAADLTAYQATANAITNRNVRNRKLSESDWVVTKALEAGETVPTAWATYRTALRDLPDHANWPNLAADDWPAEPSA